MAKIEKLIKDAQSHLEAGERIITAIMGAYEIKIAKNDSVRKGILLATDHGLVFFAKNLTGHYLEVFPYSIIRSLEIGKTLMGHHISFIASDNRVSMKWINAGDVQHFVQVVKKRIVK